MVSKRQVGFKGKAQIDPPSLRRAMARHARKCEVTPKWNTKADEHFELT